MFDLHLPLWIIWVPFFKEKVPLYWTEETFSEYNMIQLD